MPAPRTAARLDPRAPLVVDTRDLGRRAGAMRRLAFDAPAPATWGISLVEVPAGTPIHLTLRLESVMEGVLVTGAADVAVTAECGRCLEPVTSEVTADLQELFGYAPDPQDADAPVLTGDLLDLEPVIRDAVVLALPFNPVCADDCAGLCVQCGGRLADLEPGHAHETTDPRWAALAAYATEPAQPTDETEN
jgi:uncharacterized protein